MKLDKKLLTQIVSDLGLDLPFVKGRRITIKNCWHFSTDGNAVDTMFYDDEDLRNNYDSTLKVLNSSINTEIKALEYLSKHKSDWKIENEKLVFMSGKTNDEFQSILDNVANN